MSDIDVHSDDHKEYALGVADKSYSWYELAARRSRRMYRAVEIAQLVTAATIPLSSAVLNQNTIVPSILGSGIVVLTGLRAIFHWQENYLRFSHARESVEAERRAYSTSSGSYSDPKTRNRRLVAAISDIERREMGAWLEIAGPAGRQSSQPENMTSMQQSHEP